MCVQGSRSVLRFLVYPQPALRCLLYKGGRSILEKNLLGSGGNSVLLSRDLRIVFCAIKASRKVIFFFLFRAKHLEDTMLVNCVVLGLFIALALT